MFQVRIPNRTSRVGLVRNSNGSTHYISINYYSAYNYFHLIIIFGNKSIGSENINTFHRIMIGIAKSKTIISCSNTHSMLNIIFYSERVLPTKQLVIVHKNYTV